MLICVDVPQMQLTRILMHLKRVASIRRRLQDHGMPVDEAPDDSAVRETYNFAPGNFGAVYRADVPDHGYNETEPTEEHTEETQNGQDQDQGQEHDHAQIYDNRKLKYKLQSMKWGLVPFWTKRQPDYGSLMRTINCRDDSLLEDRGMWTTMKRRKRCVVVCQGFYEWLKKGPGGKEKVPHFIKHKDGDLMCFAGLWDCVTYEGSDEKLYTYTIITTSSNTALKFLHDRMPVILEPGSQEMKTWLDSTRTTWTKELQSVLKPYEGELECYAVAKEVGKVGNDSPDFIIPVNSKENKSNIANFFANAKKQSGKDLFQSKMKTESIGSKSNKLPEGMDSDLHELKVVHEKDENRTTQDNEWSEDNAPVPVEGVKREHPPEGREEVPEDDSKRRKLQATTDAALPKKTQGVSKSSPEAFSGETTTGATHDDVSLKGKDEKKENNGSQRITDFFKK